MIADAFYIPCPAKCVDGMVSDCSSPDECTGCADEKPCPILELHRCGATPPGCEPCDGTSPYLVVPSDDDVQDAVIHCPNADRHGQIPIWRVVEEMVDHFRDNNQRDEALAVLRKALLADRYSDTLTKIGEAINILDGGETEGRRYQEAKGEGNGTGRGQGTHRSGRVRSVEDRGDGAA